MKNSKFDRLYKTIMEEVKSSKKQVIKESEGDLNNEEYDDDHDFVAWVKELKQKNMDKYNIIRKNLRDYIADNYDCSVQEFEDEGCLLYPKEWEKLGADLTGMRPCPNNLMPNDQRYAPWCEDYVSQYLYDVAAVFDLDPDDLEDEDYED